MPANNKRGSTVKATKAQQDQKAQRKQYIDEREAKKIVKNTPKDIAAEKKAVDKSRTPAGGGQSSRGVAGANKTIRAGRAAKRRAGK